MSHVSNDTLSIDIWKIFDDYTSQEICFSDMELPPSYDRLKLPRKPIEIHIAYHIGQVSQVHEDKMMYDLSLSLWIAWQDERLIGQTEKAGCNPFVYRSKQPKLWIPGNAERKISLQVYNLIAILQSLLLWYQKTFNTYKSCLKMRPLTLFMSLDK